MRGVEIGGEERDAEGCRGVLREGFSAIEPSHHRRRTTLPIISLFNLLRKIAKQMSVPPPMPRQNVWKNVYSSLCIEIATHGPMQGKAA